MPVPVAEQVTLPDHTQLPDKDGSIVTNFQEHPQSTLLTGSLRPRLQELHPDGQFCIGCDSGIYWKHTSEPLKGCKAPDWFYVPGVPPSLAGQPRRSYVLWQEIIPPLVILEFVSGDGSEERDRTPWQGKFWVYERAIRPAFYGVYEVDPGRVEMYHLIETRFVPMEPNTRGHFEIPPMGVELGIWQGRYMNMELPWMRFWDLQGKLLLTGEERAEAERQRAETERQRAERYAQRLRSLGVEPNNEPPNS
jgi:Uma2 family endonuclease